MVRAKSYQSWQELVRGEGGCSKKDFGIAASYDSNPTLYEDK